MPKISPHSERFYQYAMFRMASWLKVRSAVSRTRSTSPFSSRAIWARFRVVSEDVAEFGTSAICPNTHERRTKWNAPSPRTTLSLSLRYILSSEMSGIDDVDAERHRSSITRIHHALRERHSSASRSPAESPDDSIASCVRFRIIPLLSLSFNSFAHPQAAPIILPTNRDV